MRRKCVGSAARSSTRPLRRNSARKIRVLVIPATLESATIESVGNRIAPHARADEAGLSSRRIGHLRWILVRERGDLRRDGVRMVHAIVVEHSFVM